MQGFSTGQRKRVALARALLHDPEVLFLDEPTSGLDPAATRDVIDLIGSLATEHGRTVVLCTHFLGEAGRLADRMAVLTAACCTRSGDREELAAELWDGLDAELDLGGPVDADGGRRRATEPRRRPAVAPHAERRPRAGGRPRGACRASCRLLVERGVAVYGADAAAADARGRVLRHRGPHRRAERPRQPTADDRVRAAEAGGRSASD